MVKKLEDAQRLLRSIELDDLDYSKTDEKMEAGYKRLWEMNAQRGYKDLRERLFHLILAQPFSLDEKELTQEDFREALRITGPEYDENIGVDIVQRLSLNFLREDDSGAFRFVNSTARKFVLDLPLPDATTPGAKLFSKAENSLSVANLYLDLMEDATHPYWERVNLCPSKWTELAVGDSRGDLERWEEPEGKVSLHCHLAKWGPYYLHKANIKKSMFENLWAQFLKRVVLSKVSAFGFITTARLCAAGQIYMPVWGQQHPGDRVSCVMRVREGRLELLYSHVLSGLDVISEDDLPMIQKVLDADEDEDGPVASLQQADVQRLLKHAACIGNRLIFDEYGISNDDVYQASSVQIACSRSENLAVELMLKAIGNANEVTDKTFAYSPHGMFAGPFALVSDEDLQQLEKYKIAKMLLEFERKFKSESATPATQTADAGADEKDESFTSSQWSLKVSGSPALVGIAKIFTPDQTRELLAILRPDNINAANDRGFTALHFAAMNGKLSLFKTLVETYGADFERANVDNDTPAFYAWVSQRTRILEYIKSKGGHTDFKEASSEDEGDKN